MYSSTNKFQIIKSNASCEIYLFIYDLEKIQAMFGKLKIIFSVKVDKEDKNFF